VTRRFFKAKEKSISLKNFQLQRIEKQDKHMRQLHLKKYRIPSLHFPCLITKDCFVLMHSISLKASIREKRVDDGSIKKKNQKAEIEEDVLYI
jgi:hypothetical protein